MIYILYGTEQLLIDKFIDNIIKTKKIENIVRYDLEESNLDNIIEDASYLDLFGNEKVIIVNNSLFLTSALSIETDELEKYVLNQNEKSIIFFVVHNEKIDERKKIVKFFKDKVEIKEFNKIIGYDLEKYVKSSFNEENYRIDNDGIKKIISLLGGNFKLIDNEIKKLKLYKIDDKIININDIETVITKVLEDDIFKLVEAVINNNKEKIFNIYKDLIELGEEPIKIVVMLANQFRLIYQVKVLLEDGLNKNDIATLLKVHPYRIQLAIEKSSKYQESKLLNILESLADIDMEIKSGVSDKNKALEIFFLEL